MPFIFSEPLGTVAANTVAYQSAPPAQNLLSTSTHPHAPVMKFGGALRTLFALTLCPHFPSPGTAPTNATAVEVKSELAPPKSRRGAGWGRGRGSWKGGVTNRDVRPDPSVG